MTTPAPRRLLWLLAPVAAFAATLALLTAVQGGGGAPRPAGFRPSGARDRRRPAGRFHRADDRRNPRGDRGRPGDASLHATLGDLYYLRSRETADSAWNEKAHDAYRQALALDPGSAHATTGLGTLALAKHDFAGGLRYGEQALPPRVSVGPAVRSDRGRPGGTWPLRRRAPLARPDGLAQAEPRLLRAHFLLPRAARRPGRRAPPRCAWRCRPAAASPRTWPTSRPSSATSSFSAVRPRAPSRRTAPRSRASPGTSPPRPGSPRSRGRRATSTPRSHATRRWSRSRRSTSTTRSCSRRDSPTAARPRRVRTSPPSARTRRSSARTGSTPTPSSRSSRPTMAPPRAPSSSDAPRFAPRRVCRRPTRIAGRSPPPAAARKRCAGRSRALRTGWRDPLVRYHAGMAAKLAGEPSLARRWLTQALEQSPNFSPLHAPRAERALASLG